MLTGETIKEGWKSEAVKEALDLCLACKGCKSDCPVNVDMATYKAEFLSHYYEGRLRPRSAYAMGLIDVWARLGSKMPGLVNVFTQTPGLSVLAKWAAGMAMQRKIPKFAPMTFKDWYRKRGTKNPEGDRVILWPDTFNNHFHPKTAIAAVEVLEAAGFQVIVPQMHLCCGRPLYDYGMLDLARYYLNRVITELREEIRAGVPIVGLEPSCVAVFRDELKEMMPNELDAVRLSKQTYILSEFLEEKAPHFKLPTLKRKAIIQGHCHHKSLLKFKAEQKVLSKMGMDFQVLDSGCCGMAGSFGFEKEANRYEVSMKVGERVLLPAVRKASDDTLILADGFSCRTQIEQATPRKAIHLAQAIQMALKQGQKKDQKQVQKKRMKGNTMFENRESMNTHGLYDAAENFNRALTDARRERGEPVDGLARSFYDARLWVKTNPKKSAWMGMALLLGAGVTTFILAKRTSRNENFLSEEGREAA
jgi:Fe-S oxidoreductase